MVSKQVEEELTGFPSAMDSTNVPTNDSPPIDLLSTTNLKKRRLKLKPQNVKEIGLTRDAKLQRREVRKRKMAQRYVITENIFDSLSLCSMWEYVQFYFFYLKEQETAKKGGKKKEKEVAVHETTAVQDTAIL